MAPLSALSMVEEIGGEDAVHIFHLLTAKKEITDEQISEVTGLKLNMIRKILYKLNEGQIATYRRERDPNTGWFVYFWFLRKEGLEALIQRRQREVLKVLQERLAFESQSDFYTCENQCHKLPFNDSFEIGFQCPTCGLLLTQLDNQELLETLEKKITELSTLIEDMETR